MALGFFNGMFAVAAIGSMMALAGGTGREGARMGLWGAAQAVAFGLGGLLGAGAADLARAVLGEPASAYALVFTVEALLFVVAAALAVAAIGGPVALRAQAPRAALMPGE
jgi:BCD family chlorophyll transporter-like MFS transporter